MERIGGIWYNITMSEPHHHAYLAHTQHEKKPMNIHLILSRSYAVYFFAFILGLIFDTVIYPRLGGQNLQMIGCIIIVLSTFLMYWAQTVNKRVYYLPDGTKDFSRGPYKYSRNPTQLGLFMMVVGAGLIMNSYSVVITGIIALIFSVLVVIPEEESRHIKKHDGAYLQYMKRVRRII